MPVPPTVTGYTGLTQQARLILESTPGEQLLLPQTPGAATMSLTTQPSAAFSTLTGCHLHFFVIGNTGAGTIAIAGTAPVTGNAVNSKTYHLNAAPQNSQGYSEFTTSEVFATVNASGIALTSLTPCQVIIFASPAAKILLPIVADAEEKIAKFSPQDKRGILFKNLRVVQLTKGVAVDKLDASLYPGSLWVPYMAIGNAPVITTAPTSPVSLLAATTKAATMTLTTGLATVPPGMFLIFTLAANSVAGTIVLSGLDNFGNPASETITVPASNGAVYSTKRYSALTVPSANQFTTTGLSAAATIAVGAVFAWTYTWTFDGINNLTPFSGCFEIYDGVDGYKLPYTILADASFDWQKEKEVLFAGKGMAQDLLVVGDPNPTTLANYLSGANPFATLAQPTDMPVVSWPGSFYIDLGSGTPFTTQDGSFETFKLALATGRKFFFSGDGLQRASNATWESEPDFALDATIVFQNYQYYVNYFKQNTPLIFAATFQGNLLGSSGSTTYYEQWQWTLPCKVDTFKRDMSKSPVEGVLKLLSEYNFSNLGYAYKLAVTAQIPPTYTS
jgi:hypothetical protein